MSKFYKLKIGCNNCQHQFGIKIKEGKVFGEQNYRLYHRPPLTCPKCGFQENSDYNHHQNCYFFRNFENLGPLIEIQPDKATKESVDKTDLKESKEK